MTASTSAESHDTHDTSPSPALSNHHDEQQQKHHHHHHRVHYEEMVAVVVPDGGGGGGNHHGASSFLDKLSIKSSDAASHAESTSSAPAIVEKARKVKRKVKDKLHIGHGHHDDEGDEDDESFDNDNDDDEVPLAAVRDRSRTSTSGSEHDRTLAQQYAEQYRLPDGEEASNSPRSSGLATPLGAGDHTDDDDDDGNIIILHTGSNKSAPNLLTHVQKGSLPGTPASLKALKSPPGTKDTASTSGSPSRHRARSSVSLPASQSDWRRRAGEHPSLSWRPPPAPLTGLLAEFHNLFEGKVDEEEHLVSDYACAWVKDVSVSAIHSATISYASVCSFRSSDKAVYTLEPAISPSYVPLSA